MKVLPCKEKAAAGQACRRSQRRDSVEGNTSMNITQRYSFEQHQTVTLLDGPLDGAKLELPFDSQCVSIVCEQRPHRYYRLTGEPTFYHESLLMAASGGARHE
jgi:hypothetical protein